MRTLRALLAFTLAYWMTGAPALSAAIINAASASSTDITTAVTSASPGDTVVVPAGSATWNAGSITIAKGITLDGSAGVTISKGTGSGGALLLNMPTSTTFNIRVTGFTFTSTGSDYIDLGYDFNNRFSGAKFRIDHNSFACTNVGSGFVGVRVQFCYGLLDHNTWTGDDGSEMLQNQAWSGPDAPSGSGGWGPPTVDSSSTDAVYISDSVFQKLTQTSTNYGATTGFNMFGGSRTIAINNTMKYVQMDAHGTFSGGVEYVGTRWFWIKGNHWVMPSGSHDQSIYGDLRAGSGVWANNDLSGGTNNHPGGGAVQLRYENSGATYPAPYQIGSDYSTNSPFTSPNYYSTNQTRRGVWLFGNDAGFTIVNGTSSLIQLGRDYFLSDPSLTAPPYPSPLAIPALPVSPAAVGASASTIVFSWTIGTQVQTAPQGGVYIYRSPHGANTFTLVHTATATDVSWTDTGLPQQTAYDYEAQAFCLDNTSSVTAIQTGTTFSSTTPTSPLLRGSKSGVPGFGF